MTDKNSKAWIEALKEKTMPELKNRLSYLENMTYLLTSLYNRNPITYVDIWVDYVDNTGNSKGNKKKKPDAYNSFNISLEGDEVPEAFLQFIHDFCTILCAEKLVVETLIERKPELPL